MIGNIIATTLVIVLSGGNPILGALIYSVVMPIDHAIEQGRNVKAGDLYGYFMQTFVMSGITMGATKGIGGYFVQFKKSGLRELNRALAHGAFNSAMRYAQGGKFEHGFMSGFVYSNFAKRACKFCLVGVMPRRLFAKQSDSAHLRWVAVLCKLTLEK